MGSLAYAKSKGRDWENAICGFLGENGYPQAERRRLNGVNDRGDIAGFPGLVIEAKHEKSYKLPEWVKEAKQEAFNDGKGTPLGSSNWVVWARRNGKPDPGDGFVIMDGYQFKRWLHSMGW